MESLWASYDERRWGIKRDRGVGFTAPVDRALAELTSALYTMTPVAEEELALEELDNSRFDCTYFVTDWSYLNKTVVGGIVAPATARMR